MRFAELLKQRRLVWIANTAVALLVGFLVADRVARFAIAERPGFEESRDESDEGGLIEWDIEVVKRSFLFGQTVRSVPVDVVDAVSTSLSMTLQGIVVQGRSGFALISVDGKPEELFQLNQRVAPGVRLAAILSDRVILERDSRFEALVLEGWEWAQASGAGGSNQRAHNRSSHPRRQPETTVSLQAIREHVQTPQELLSQAVLAPSGDGGFLLQEVQAGSLLEQLGLRAGDVVRSANGQQLYSVDDIRRVYQQLADVRRLKLELLRDGRAEELSFEIVN